MSKEDDQRRKTFNGLTAKEWAQLSKNVWNDVSSPRKSRHLRHGAVFPLKLAERVIALYSREGDLIFDPFAGICTTAVAAAQMGRNAVAMELNQEFVQIGQDWIAENNTLLDQLPERVDLLHDDSRNLLDYLEPDSIQLTFTSPPYADFIQRSVADRAKTHKKSRFVYDNNSRVRQYSTDERDFGNLPYGDFLDECESLLESLLKTTRPGGYSVWVVKDHRLPPHQPYVPFHSDLAQRAERVGWKWHDLIVWDQNAQRKLVLLGYPSRFYTNQNCSFLVVLRRSEH